MKHLLYIKVFIGPLQNRTTVGPLYKGHIGTSKFVHCREVVHSSEVESVLALYESIFGTLESVLCCEVVYMVSFIRRVL